MKPETLQEAIKPLQADLFVLRGRTKPRRKREALDYEFHLNPLGLAALAVGGALTLAIMQLRWQRVTTQVISVKTIDVYWPYTEVHTADDYLPKGYSWEPPTIDQTIPLAFQDAKAMGWFGAIASGGFDQVAMLTGLVVKTANEWGIVDWPKRDQDLKAIMGIIPATGHWEQRPRTGDHGGYPAGSMENYWVEDAPAHEGVVKWHLTGHIYGIFAKTVNQLAERKSLVQVV